MEKDSAKNFREQEGKQICRQETAVHSRTSLTYSRNIFIFLRTFPVFAPEEEYRLRSQNPATSKKAVSNEQSYIHR
jgi:hypothetical protein